MTTEISESLGQGTYGTVYSTSDPNIVEKIFNLERQPHIFYHECAAYQVLSPHESLPQIYKIENTPLKKSIHIERFDSDLATFLQNKNLTPDKNLTAEETKLIIFQLLHGVHYAHSRGICHGDIKPQNILINKETLKVVICDWGSSQFINPLNRDCIPEILTTLYYKAPEILLSEFGAGKYNVAVDIWSVGILITELVTGQPIFKGENETTQLDEIYKILGNPKENNWFTSNRKKPQVARSTSLDAVVSTEPLLQDLINRLLVLNPLDRLGAWQCLNHKYFKTVRNAQYNSYSTDKSYDILVHYNDDRIFQPSLFKDFIFNIYKEEAFDEKVIILTGYYMDRYFNAQNKMDNKIALACLNIARMILIDCVLDLEDMQNYLTMTAEELAELCSQVGTVLDYDLYCPTEYDHLLAAGRDMEKGLLEVYIERLLKISFETMGDYDYKSLIELKL